MTLKKLRKRYEDILEPFLLDCMTEKPVEEVWQFIKFAYKEGKKEGREELALEKLGKTIEKAEKLIK